MLELPNKHIKKMSEILLEARKQLKNRCPDWTDHSAHDPGMTMIELLAHLQVKQQKAINTIGDRNRQKYLELLQITQEPIRCAQTEVVFSTSASETYLPARTKLKAKDIIFETADRMVVFNNQLQSIRVWNATKEQLLLERESEVDKQLDWYAFGHVPMKGNQLYLGFAEAFPANKEIRCKWDMFEDYPVKRNAVGVKDNFHPLVKLCWEYYGEQDGHQGWHKLEIARDTTHDLLFSGFITFIIKGRQLPYNDAKGQDDTNEYSLRCSLIDGEYDVPPKVKRLFLNCARVQQKHTICQSWVFTRQEVMADRVVIDSWLANYGHWNLFIREHDCWMELQQHEYIVEIDEQSKLSTVVFYPTDSIGDNEDKADEEQPYLKVVVWERSSYTYARIGSSTGWIHQKIDLELNHIIEDEFQLMIAEDRDDGKRVWRDWQQIQSLSKATKDQTCYELDSTSGVLYFGDNRKGLVPRKGLNNIMITDCAMTRASYGNILRAKIDGFADQAENSTEINVHQLLPATGGKAKEEIGEAETRMLKDLKTGYRAVNVEDYRRIVHKVPGLMVRHVKVLPLYKPGLESYPENKEDNCITLVIEPFSTVGPGVLSTAYKKNILDYLEQYRLITTKVYVIEPVYVGLELYGEIVIKANYKNAASVIEEAIRKYIVQIEQKQQGRVQLNYGDLYGTIDLLGCVSHIRNLGIEAIGHRVTKTKKGDILIPADSRFYVKESELTLINSEHM